MLRVLTVLVIPKAVCKMKVVMWSILVVIMLVIMLVILIIVSYFIFFVIVINFIT